MYHIIRPSQDFQNSHIFLFLLTTCTLQRKCEYMGIIKVMLWVCKDVQCNGNEFINHVNTVSLMQISLSTVCNYVSSKTGYITFKSQLTPSTIEIHFFYSWKLSHTSLYLNFILFLNSWKYSVFILYEKRGTISL